MVLEFRNAKGARLQISKMNEEPTILEADPGMFFAAAPPRRLKENLKKNFCCGFFY